MNRTTMTVSLPPALRDWVEKSVASGIYANASEYVRELIRRDVRSERARIDRALVAGIESGPGESADDAWWESLRRESQQRTKNKRSA